MLSNELDVINNSDSYYKRLMTLTSINTVDFIHNHRLLRLKGVLLSLHFIILLNSSIKAQKCDLPLFDSTQIVIETDIFYGQALTAKMERQDLLLDLYYPSLNVDTSQSRPLVLLIHGGWFQTGNKRHTDIRILCEELAMRGYVCSAINYRLGHDKTKFGQYKARYRGIQDANAALRFLVSNTEKYNIDEDWIFIGGQSAGSVIAYGVIHADEAECDSISFAFEQILITEELGNLNDSGNGLKTIFSIKGLFNNWGGVPENELQSSELVPTISFHGALDSLVAIGVDSTYLNFQLYGSKAMNTQLIEAEICSELIVDSLGGHGIFRNESSAYRAWKASCFFKSIMCNSCESIFTTDSIPTSCQTYDYQGLSLNHESLVAYPNPTEDYFNLIGINEPAVVRVYNSSGHIIANLISPNRIDLSNHPNGLYIIDVTFVNNGRKPIRIKLTKKK